MSQPGTSPQFYQDLDNGKPFAATASKDPKDTSGAVKENMVPVTNHLVTDADVAADGTLVAFTTAWRTIASAATTINELTDHADMAALIAATVAPKEMLGGNAATAIVQVMTDNASFTDITLVFVGFDDGGTPKIQTVSPAKVGQATGLTDGTNYFFEAVAFDMMGSQYGFVLVSGLGGSGTGDIIIRLEGI